MRVQYLIDKALDEPRAFEIVFEALAPHARPNSTAYVCYASQDGSSR